MHVIQGESALNDNLYVTCHHQRLYRLLTLVSILMWGKTRAHKFCTTTKQMLTFVVKRG